VAAAFVPPSSFGPTRPTRGEREIASYVGTNQSNGLTGVVLWEESGKMSPLEFYSLDGHQPWFPASIETLNGYERHA
jgi:hypothetical protein